MVKLPESEQEFLLWKLEKQDYEAPFSQQELECTWQWLIRNHARFQDRMLYILETDAGLGYQTYVYLFDNTCVFYACDAAVHHEYTFDHFEQAIGKVIEFEHRLI